MSSVIRYESLFRSSDNNLSVTRKCTWLETKSLQTLSCNDLLINSVNTYCTYTKASYCTQVSVLNLFIICHMNKLIGRLHYCWLFKWKYKTSDGVNVWNTRIYSFSLFLCHNVIVIVMETIWRFQTSSHRLITPVVLGNCDEHFSLETTDKLPISKTFTK